VFKKQVNDSAPFWLRRIIFEKIHIVAGKSEEIQTRIIRIRRITAMVMIEWVAEF